MTSLQLSLPTASVISLISTSRADLKTKRHHDSRSYAAKTLELQFGFIIEDYITKGKDRFKTYIEEHRRFCAEFIKKDEIKRGNSHKMKEIKVQHRVWTLLLHLFNSKTVKNKSRNTPTNNNYYFNPKAFIHDRFNGDYKLRKLEHVILWLQDIAPSPYFLNRGDISYSRTLNQSNDSKHPSLNSLDPDVMSRMNININTLSKQEMDDLNDEEKLLNIVFRLIRKGKWDQAADLCRNYGCHYRASSINGRQLFSDQCNVVNGVDGIGGNDQFLMWLRVCNQICRKTHSLSEKWIYAALCGNVDELLTYVINDSNDGNWYDLLWVLAICKKVYVQHQILSNELPSYYHNDMKHQQLNDNKHIFGTLNIINCKWETQLIDFNTMFNWIEQTNHAFITKEVNQNQNEKENKAQMSDKTNLISKLFGFAKEDCSEDIEDGTDDGDSDYFSSEYNYQYYKICKFIICEQYDDLLQSCWDFINNERLRKIKNGITLDFMRFIIHLYMHLNPNIAQRGQSSTDLPQLFMQFIIKYIEELKKCLHYEQIARYCFILPKKQLIATLTSFFLSLSSVKLRIDLIAKARDVLPSDIIKKISANIAKHVIDESIENSKKSENKWKEIETICEVEMDDLHKIDSLTCLKIVRENNNEILFRANQLFTMFAKEYKFQGIQRLFNDICTTMDGIKPSSLYSNNNSEYLRGLQCHLNSYECFSLYKSVIDAFYTWNKHHFDMNTVDKEKIRNIDLFIKFSRNMLLYKYGWLNPRYCAIQQLNFEEINEIRSVILSRLLDILYRFIRDTGQYEFCLELTTIFANEKYSYYKLFDKNNKNVIKKLLNHAKDSKIEIIKYQQQIYRMQQQQQLI